VQAQTTVWPTRSVTIIVPTAPGGGIDTTARVVAERLAPRWGKPVVVENRAGASMRIGATAVARAPADGYTLLVAHDGTMAMNPVVFPDLAYDPERDFEPVAMISSIPEVLIVSQRLPVRNVAELIDLARREPGRIDHASGGTATLLALELFKSMAGVDIRDIPYRGGAPAVAAVIAGDVGIAIADITTANAAFQTDKVRRIAVTSVTRSRAHPAIPTLDQSGVPGYEVNTWMGLFAPARTPPEVIARIGEDVREVLQMPDLRTRLESLGMEIRSGTAAEMRRVLSADRALWGNLVRSRGIRIEQ
jgi:tripartite-type tricarboxylate transporter receptor subunit TctC